MNIKIGLRKETILSHHKKEQNPIMQEKKLSTESDSKQIINISSDLEFNESDKEAMLRLELEEDAFNELSNKNAPQTIQKKNPLDLLDMGMTQSECLKILGKPDDIVKSASNNSIIEQWYYYDKYWLKFVNGYLLVYADMKSYKKNMQIIQDFFKK